MIPTFILTLLMALMPAMPAHVKGKLGSAPSGHHHPHPRPYSPTHVLGSR